MPRASESQRAERLNRARELCLQHVDQLADAVEQLAHDCSISPRQAYRSPGTRSAVGNSFGPAPAKPNWHSPSETSTQPGPARPAHVCYSQKDLVHQRGGQPSVARAAATRTRAWVSRNQIGTVPCSWNIDSTVCCQTSSRTCISYSSPTGASQSEETRPNKRIPPQE